MPAQPPSIATRLTIGRRFLLASASGALLAGTRPGAARAADSAITFGSITPGTGSYGYAGKLVTNGSQLAIELAGGEILGRRLDYITRDDEGSAATGVRRLSEAVSGNGLAVFNGAYSSAIGLAESAVARREKVLQYAAGGSEDFTGARCSRYTFQWSANPYTALKAVLDYLTQAHPAARRVYTITADYIFGQALLRYATIVGPALGLEFVGNAAAPLGTQEFTQFLTQALAAKPDVICLLTAGEDAIVCLRQLAGFGARNLVVAAPWAIETEQLSELPPEIREGLILGENYVPTIDTPANQEFVAAYRKKYNTDPGYSAAYGYDSFRTVLLAMRKANSTDLGKVISTLEGMQFDGVLGPSRIDADTHQTVRPYFVVLGKAAASPDAPNQLAAMVHVGSDNQPRALNACKGLGPL